jgi:hypothetical protein
VSRIKRYRPTAPIVINLIALFIVLGGQAFALAQRTVVTRKDFAAGAVTARNLAPGIVTTGKLGNDTVTKSALAKGAVTGRAIRPSSIRGDTLAGTIQIPTAIPDVDAIAGVNWTTSSGTASCPSGAMLLDGGMAIQSGGNNKAAIQSLLPSSSNASTWVGAITSDTGGGSPAQLYAYCLR